MGYAVGFLLSSSVVCARVAFYASQGPFVSAGTVYLNLPKPTKK